MLPNGRRRSPPFVAELQKQEGTAAKAFEFAILTAARTNEALGAVWSEIDFNERIWAVPSNRMKGGREHRVPLADKAIAILKEMRSSGGESGADAFILPLDVYRPEAPPKPMPQSKKRQRLAP